MAGTTAAGRQADRHSTTIEAESLHSDLQAGGRKLTGNGVGFYNLKAHHSDTSSSTRPHLLIFPKQSHQLGTKFTNI